MESGTVKELKMNAIDLKTKSKHLTWKKVIRERWLLGQTYSMIYLKHDYVIKWESNLEQGFTKVAQKKIISSAHILLKITISIQIPYLRLFKHIFYMLLKTQPNFTYIYVQALLLNRQIYIHVYKAILITYWESWTFNTTEVHLWRWLSSMKILKSISLVKGLALAIIV